MASFEDDLSKLESVVERLERGELSLDDSVRLFEEGMRLSNACKGELERAEGRIQVLVAGPGGGMRVAEVEVDGAGDDGAGDDDAGDDEGRDDEG